ncbi:MAG: hypothetical protein ACTTH3_06660 [Schwartzia sp. (in: firmicutes)]
MSFQWDATSYVMEDWMQKYALDPNVQDWRRKVNSWALHRIADVRLSLLKNKRDARSRPAKKR